MSNGTCSQINVIGNPIMCTLEESPVAFKLFIRLQPELQKHHISLHISPLFWHLHKPHNLVLKRLHQPEKANFCLPRKRRRQGRRALALTPSFSRPFSELSANFIVLSSATTTVTSATNVHFAGMERRKCLMSSRSPSPNYGIFC